MKFFIVFVSLVDSMGLLDKLWDDVVAGPMPDRGLGRLRRPGGHHHHHQDLDHDGGKTIANVG